ncbi:MAG: glycosyltransferase family 4 protein [Clostridia bacterium]|nr:glycosyltransferase family 4 protein [Clostridia bacterium]
MEKGHERQLTIAVDMIPYRKDGSNGGIVPATVETIRGLKDYGLTIYILTSQDNFEHLRFLEKLGAKCVNVEEEPQKPDAAVHSAPLIITDDSNIIPAKVQIYHKVKHHIAGIVPQGIYDFCVRHATQFRNIRIALTHPYEKLFKPIARWIAPHRLVEYHVKRNLIRITDQRDDTKENRIIDTKRSLRELIGEAVDVMYCPFTGITYYDPSVPCLSQINDIQHKYLPFFFTDTEFQNRERFYQDLIEKHCYLFAISDYTRKTFIDSYSISEDRIRTIHLSIRDRLQTVSDGECKKKLADKGLENIEFAFYPANFWKHKNHKTLILAYNMFKIRHPESQLHLVFTGYETEEIDDLHLAIQKMGLEQSIHFLGYVDDEMVSVLYQTCKYFVFPSLFEGFGLPLLEAMNAGKPILCSNVTSIPEIVGNCAVFFDPYDPESVCQALEDVESHPSIIMQKMKTYDKQLEKFSEDVYLKALVDYMWEIKRMENKS